VIQNFLSALFKFQKVCKQLQLSCLIKTKKGKIILSFGSLSQKIKIFYQRKSFREKKQYIIKIELQQQQ
jgi:hypothetical protein